MQWDSAYDGDGTRTTQHLTQYDQNGLPLTPVLTVYFMGGLYEEIGGEATKYYGNAGISVAMNDSTGMNYLLTDHLGSVDVVTDAPKRVRQSGPRVLSPPLDVTQHLDLPRFCGHD